MEGKDLNKEFIELIESNIDIYAEDNKKTMDMVKNSDATFNGVPVPTLYSPYFVTEKDLENFNYITGTMISIIDKVTEEYLQNKEYRKQFRYPEFIEELIEIDNGYDINAPIGRFDFFYDGKDDFTFVELNTDGASCMNEDNTIAKILLETKASKKMQQKYDLEYFELFESWVDSSIEIFKKYDSNNKKPNVAIMDFEESATMTDFNKFKLAYERKGYNCKIVDPRDVEYRNGKMYYGDYRIDLVYRRIVTFELINNYDEIKEFIEAYKNQAFCCIGSIRSQIGHNKIFFKVLHDEDTLKLLSEEEREFVKKHVPYTGIFGEKKEIFSKVLNNKDKYIMKPMDMNASQGVFVGRDLDYFEWKIKLEEVWNNDYIYQEFIEPRTREFAKFDGIEFNPESFGVVVGVFLYNEKIAGVYNRIGNESIISNVADYYSIPGIKVNKKHLQN